MSRDELATKIAEQLRQWAVTDFRLDELDAVMQSVDKWFDKGDSRLHTNPASRAADAREIALQAIEAEKALRVGVQHTVAATAGGIVEGQPTSIINYLQRIRELREIEKDHSRLMKEVAEIQERSAIDRLDAKIADDCKEQETKA